MCDECGHYKERQLKETEDSKKLMELVKEAVKQTKKMKLPKLNGFDKSKMYYKNLETEAVKHHYYKERQFKETEDSKKLMKLIKEAVKQTKKMKLPRLNGFDKSEMYYKNLDPEEVEQEKRT